MNERGRHQPFRAFPRATDHDRHGVGMLDEETCLRLLGTQPVGRLGFSAGALPVIFPVNYFLADDTIVFRSEDGEKTRAADTHVVACLEIDQVGGFEHSGWSVLATGRLRLAAPERMKALRRLPLAPWAIHGANQFVEMPIELVSGRVVDR